MTASMLAARMLGNEAVEMVECPRPDPGPGQVRVRVQGCGVCASNLPLWHGRSWFRYPTAPGQGGHEAWGIVDAVGAGVDAPAEGTRVACLGDGAFAEFVVTAADCVLPLPSGWADDRPAPGEPLACAINVFRRSGIVVGQPVVIVGIGFLGALLVQLTAAAGARPLAISRQPFARNLARELGAEAAFGWDDGADAIVAAVHERTGGRGAACVIEVTGKQEPLDLAAKLTAERGRMVVAGYHQDGARQVDMQLWNWRGFDVVNAHERDSGVCMSGMREALRLVAAGTMQPDTLYSLNLPLAELPAALTAAAERPAGFYKALVQVAS